MAAADATGTGTCGRVDLPGSCPAASLRLLDRKLCSGVPKLLGAEWDGQMEMQLSGEDTQGKLCKCMGTC